MIVYIAWNSDKTEGAVFIEERDAMSACDGKHRYDPKIGMKCISTLADAFYETYGEDACSVEKTILGSQP